MTAYSLQSERIFLHSTPFQLILLGGGLVAVSSANPFLTLAAVFSLPILAGLVWRPGEPPVLAFVLSMQWLQIVAKVFHADLLGVPVSALHEFNGDVEQAVWLSLLGLSALAVGMRLAMRSPKTMSPFRAREEAFWLSPRKLWLAYLAGFGAYIALRGIAWVIPGITQIVLALANVKWVFLFVLVYVVMVRRAGTALLGAAIVIEVIAGITGFFSGFKGVFFLLMIAFLTVNPALSARRAVSLLLLGGLLIALSVFWTAAKVDYRTFVSGGTRAQVILVGWDARADHLVLALQNFDSEDARRGLEDLAERVAYVDYFAVALNHVPSVVPHENGALLGKALLHLVTPRLLFPDKPPTPRDTDITAKYTGLSFAAAGAGTSISLGYMAESYVDFGSFGMLLAILAFGYLLSWMFAVLVGYSGTPLLLNYGLATAVLMSVYALETAMIKIVGSVVTLFLVALVLQRYVFPRIVPWLRTAGRRFASGAIAAEGFR